MNSSACNGRKIGYSHLGNGRVVKAQALWLGHDDFVPNYAKRQLKLLVEVIRDFRVEEVLSFYIPC